MKTWHWIAGQTIVMAIGVAISLIVAIIGYRSADPQRIGRLEAACIRQSQQISELTARLSVLESLDGSKSPSSRPWRLRGETSHP